MFKFIKINFHDKNGFYKSNGSSSLKEWKHTTYPSIWVQEDDHKEDTNYKYKLNIELHRRFGSTINYLQMSQYCHIGNDHTSSTSGLRA